MSAAREAPASPRSSRRLPARIGYADVAFALKNHFSYFAMKNRSGKFATPGARGILAAAMSDVKPDATTNALSIVNPPKKFPLAYPISTYTYVIVPLKTSKAADLRKFLFWAVTHGQEGKYTAAAPLRPDPEGCPRRRREGDHQDPELGRGCPPPSSRLKQPAAPSRGGGCASATCSLQLVAGLAAAAATVLVFLIAWKVVEGARPAIAKFGLHFVTHVVWNPVVGQGSLRRGELPLRNRVTSLFALALAAPLAIGVALFLTELAPRALRAPVTSLVETLAAIPSVVIGFWGIYVLGPILAQHVEPALHSALGFIPLFGPPGSTGSSIFTAIVVLTMMILPIVSSITRELFLGVPRELKEGALALGTTRWEMVRGVIFPYARGGILAALDPRPRARDRRGDRGDAGDRRRSRHPLESLLDRRHAREQDRVVLPGRRDQPRGALADLSRLILLVFSLLASVSAQWIVRRVARRQGVGLNRGGLG